MMLFVDVAIPPSVTAKPNRSQRGKAVCFTSELLERRLLLASVPDGFTDSTITSNLDSPTAMDIAPDGRIFIAGQKGHLWVVENGERTLITQLSGVNSSDERGFLGLTVDPDFASNGFLYVYYTRNTDPGINNRVSRLTISGDSASNETTVIDLPDIGGAIFHMGGAMQFGTDGRLYIAVGDYQNGNNSQSMSTLAGKILRINSDGSIPSDNPFFDSASGVNRAIWALGLRNPFTFDIQRGTGRIFINDVGETSWEEVNEGAAGANFGWPQSEGPDNTSGFTAPVYFYSHDEGCAIVGGAFYNPQNPTFPLEYHGEYFFADLCSGWIRSLDPNSFTASEFATGLSFPVDVTVSPQGHLYYLNRGTGITDGHLGEIRFTAVGAPVINTHPQSQTVAFGATAQFSVQASGDNLGYQWQFNNQDISGANQATHTINSANSSDAGQYRVIVSNDIASVASNPATLTVIQGNPPQASIDSPAPGTTFRGGQTFTFSGSATDVEDGALGPGAFTWQIDYHTGEVVRPFVSETSGITEGTITIPTETPFKGSNAFYRIILKVTDSDGASTTVTRDIQPVIARVVLRSNIPGAQVLLDGAPRNTPSAFIGIAGIKRQITAESILEINGVRYLFDGWSDGGQSDHWISTPVSETSYVARYRVAPDVTSTKGLAMTVFNNRDRTGTMITTNVPNIDFDFGEGSPHPLIHRDTFFIRFRGKVQPEFSETYTFHARADDGVRLFVNGQLLIDQWEDHDGSELSGSIDLQAGIKYDIRFDYYENVGNAFAHLEWSSPSQQKEIIPRSRFFSTIMPQTLAPTADAYVQGGAASGTNFGSDGLIVKTAAEQYQREVYLKFDIRDLNPDSIGSAKLRLFGNLSADHEINLPTAVYHAPGAKWGEESITWENRPQAASKAISTITVPNANLQYWDFDITNFLRMQREMGRTIVTFVLRNLDASQVFTSLASRESNFPPSVVVAI